MITIILITIYLISVIYPIVWSIIAFTTKNGINKEYNISVLLWPLCLIPIVNTILSITLLYKNPLMKGKKLKF